MKKVLIIDDIHPILEETFNKTGFVCHVKKDIDYQSFLNLLPNYHILILRSRYKINKEVIDIAKNLEVIGRVGAGLENINIAYAEKNGVVCFNSPEGNRDSVGEHSVGLLLCVLNNICQAHNELNKGVWNRNSNWGTEIKGKTIGIIGCGNMGNAFAQRLIGFGAKVIAYDKYKTNYSTSFVKEATMEQLFKECDIVSLHVPYTSETHYLINKNYLHQFKKSIVLLNTARGKVVNTKDLIWALESGKVLGAGLDVLEFENSDFEDIKNVEHKKTIQNLLSFKNVITTPHIAGWSNESYRKLSEFMVKKIINYYRQQ